MSLTTSNDVLGKFSPSVLSFGNHNKLTSVNLTTFGFENPEEFNVQNGINHRTLKSASSQFSLDYYTDDFNDKLKIKSQVKQSEINLVTEFTPKKNSRLWSGRLDVDLAYRSSFS